MNNECQLCGRPSGYPFCNDACRDAAPGDDVPVHEPPEDPLPDWRPGDPCPF